MQGLLADGVLLWVFRIGSVLIGGAGGFLFYKFIGCRSGSCPITSNPWLSTIYGALLGALLFAR